MYTEKVKGRKGEEIEMGERYFRNELPNFIPETNLLASDFATTCQQQQEEEDSLAKLLCLPYTTLVDKFKTAALHFKQLVSHPTDQISNLT